MTHNYIRNHPNGLLLTEAQKLIVHVVKSFLLHVYSWRPEVTESWRFHMRSSHAFIALQNPHENDITTSSAFHWNIFLEVTFKFWSYLSWYYLFIDALNYHSYFAETCNSWVTPNLAWAYSNLIDYEKLNYCVNGQRKGSKLLYVREDWHRNHHPHSLSDRGANKT